MAGSNGNLCSVLETLAVLLMTRLHGRVSGPERTLCRVDIPNLGSPSESPFRDLLAAVVALNSVL